MIEVAEATKEQPAVDKPTEGSKEQPAPETKQFGEVEVQAIVKEALDKQYKKLNKSLSDLGAENKKLKDMINRPSTSAKTLQGVVDEMERTSDPNDTSATTRIRTLKAQIAQEEQQLAYDVQMQKQEAIAEEHREKLCQKIVTAGFDPEDDDLIDVWREVSIAKKVDGEFEWAEKKLDKILKSKAKKEEKVPDKVVESEVKMRERIKREVLEEYKLTSPEKATPSATRLAEEERLKQRFPTMYK